MNFATRYTKLNAAQKQAVDTIDGPVMVIAGPGTGKTELLSMRAANILQKTDTLPQNILCLTFTESGAAAMRERLVSIIGPDGYKVAIHTFHSFGAEVINQNSEFFYHGANFRAADELSSYELLRTIFDELEYANPLAGKMNGEYTYLSDTLSTISELKKSGLTSDELLAVLDANDRVIEVAEPLLAAAFSARLSKKTIDQLEPLVAQIRAGGGEVSLPAITPLSRVLADSLDNAIVEAQTSNSTKPITSFKNTWLKKNDAGEFVLKSKDRSAKLRAVSFVYYQYLARMQEAELYDFDDMILRVVHAMEVFSDLKFNLQEKYQYIMVDEFQDTNMAQMRILFDLTNNEINNNRPNILVVGDDDQAIYSFQGADVGNISYFRDLFATTTLITLIDNYRSSERILERARSVITQGTDRLENHIPELNKTLTAHSTPAASSVSLVEHATSAEERQWLADTIATHIKQGVSPASIAVLARRHHEIIALLPYFAKANITVNYERRDNILELATIKSIEHIAQLLVALFEQRHDVANSLLPELLSHPAFAISPVTLWRLGITAQENHQSWMEILAVTPEFMPLHTWLATRAQALKHTPLEQMLDEIIGNIPSAEDDAFISPLYNYYFSQAQLEDHPDAYLTHLEALRTIRTKLKEYLPNETPSLQSFIEFIRMHRQLGSTITSVRPKNDRLVEAVTLMTAHKSKGLEFDRVYVIGAVDNAWGERVRGRNRLISYPENLPLSPTGDTPDERLRLFFVAMTRAKAHLTLSYSTLSDSGKSTLRAGFLASSDWEVERHEQPSTIAELTTSAELAWYQPIIEPIGQDMRESLAPLLARYKLSATHLNAFLDVSRGGPHTFLMNNLLHFPQAKSPSASYGSAIHLTLQRTHSHLVATGKQRPIEDILHDYEENLQAQNLSEKDFQVYLQKGSDALSDFLEYKYDEFNQNQKAELTFRDQAVHIGEAHLTGSLDLVDITDSTISVTDYKTGKPIRGWVGKTDYEKIKLHKFKQQLMFYHLLIQHSRDYSKYTVDKGILQFIEPTNQHEIITLEAEFSDEDLAQFTKLVCAVWKHITTLDLPDTSSYEPSFKGMLAFEAYLLSNSVDEKTT